jgi:hypothetical protein
MLHQGSGPGFIWGEEIPDPAKATQEIQEGFGGAMKPGLSRSNRAVQFISPIPRRQRGLNLPDEIRAMKTPFVANP